MREIELILFSGGLDRLRADAVDALLAEVRRLRAELAGYVEGYDPKVKPVPENALVVVELADGDSYICEIRDEGMRDELGGWLGPVSQIARWYRVSGGSA